MLRLCEAERKGELMESAVCCPGSPWTISRLKVQPDGSPSTSSVASVVWFGVSERGGVMIIKA